MPPDHRFRFYDYGIDLYIADFVDIKFMFVGKLVYNILYPIYRKHIT